MKKNRRLKTTNLLSAIVLLFLLIFFSSSPAMAWFIPVPTSQQAFFYDPIYSPIVLFIPEQARPIGVSLNSNTLRLQVSIAPFSEPVDIYFGIYVPAVDNNNIYILNSDNVLQPVSQGLVPWKNNIVRDINQNLFGDINISQIPSGKYHLYIAVTPAGRQDSYFLWETYFDLFHIATGRSLSALQPVHGCNSLVKSLKDRAIREMQKTIDNLIQDVLQWGCPKVVDTIGFSASPSPPPDGTGAVQYSETNVQVAGVDEADFVKNDSAYIYILADERFQIIKAWPPQQSHVLSSVPIEGMPKKLFITSDRALVYSSLDPIEISGLYDGPWAGYYYPDMPECTYGYDCDFIGDGRKLKITIFDISDRSKPKVIREIWMSGSFLNARRIGTAVHTAILFPPISFHGVSYWPDIMNKCWDSSIPNIKGKIIAALEELKEKNRLAINNIDNEEILDNLPQIKDTRYINGEAVTEENLLENCQNFYESGRPDGQSFLTVLSLDIDDMEYPQTTTISGRPGAVYASKSSLYIASRQEYTANMDWYFPVTDEAPKEASTIHKFSLSSDPANSKYAGSGVVKGRVLNQFSMDEFNGYLRIATTSGHLPDLDTHSTVSVFEEENGELVIIGQIDNIAPSEDIRSARFYGKRGFLVTFKKTDPLFALDMTDPAGPRIVGELKIPGYSTYMQLMDDEHLITIGYDAQDEGNFAWFQGIMLQIFDIRDIAVPKLIHKEIIGTRGSTSEAATNHLAFNYFAPKDLLAIPITICTDGYSSYYGEMTFSGLLVYDVTVENGFRRRGGVSHVDPMSEQSYQMCANWWTQSNSVVKRSIFMDDYVFSISMDMIKVDHLDNLGKDIAVIDLLN